MVDVTITVWFGNNTNHAVAMPCTWGEQHPTICTVIDCLPKYSSLNVFFSTY